MARRAINLAGQRFGRLVVIDRATEMPGVWWYCICDCGKRKKIRSSQLRYGSVKSCGCLRDEMRAEHNKPRHGDTGTRLYSIWRGMKKRCYQPTSAGYKNYGGRGITVCDEWISSYESFRDWALANGYTDELTLDRKDSNGNYNPSNCRFASYIDQENNRRNCHYIEMNGVKLTVAQWARITNTPPSTLKNRIASKGEREAVKISLTKCKYDEVGGS